MCNRSEGGETDHIRRIFNASIARAFNDGPKVLYPKAPGPIVRMVDGELVIEQKVWGRPRAMRSTRDPSKFNKPTPVNNARFDKLTGWWAPFATNPVYRCLIPTARYAEAVGPDGAMTEAWLSVKDQLLFAWAGLWGDSDEWGDWYTGVMTANAPELRYIHDRSPVLLDPKDWATWLTAPLADLYQFEQPFPADRIAVDITDTPWVQRGSDAPKLL